MSPRRNRSSDPKEIRYVRLKPYDKGKGHTTRRIMIDKLRFFAGRWHLVDVKDIEKYGLEERKQKTNDRDSSALMFDIATKEEAIAIDVEDKRIRESAPDTAAQAVDLRSTR